MGDYMDRRLPHLPGVPHLDVNRPLERHIYINESCIVPELVVLSIFCSFADCQDGYHTCHIWAAKGDCTKNKAWVTKNCKRSCRVCGGL